MRVDLARPLPSGGTLTIDIAWRFRVPPYGAGRMGHDGTLYELGQWYPRMAVYDDVKGWNTEPYIGGGEFYLEYGRFDVNLTVPFDYIVAATGTLRNPDDVLTPAQRERLARAKTSATPIAIIGDEVGTGATRPETVGHAGMALQRRFRPRLRLRRRAQLPLGRERLRRHPDPHVLPPNRDALARGQQDGARGGEVLQRAVDEVPLCADLERRGPDRGHGVPDDHLRSRRAEPRGTPVGGGARDRAPVDPDGRRSQRAALSLDGRGLQHLHRPRQHREVLRRHALRRLDRGAPAAPLSRPCGGRPGTAAHHPPGREPRPLLDRLPEAGAHDADPALSRARQGGVRPRVPRLPAHLGLQAPDAGRLLPDHARQHRASSSTGSGTTGSTARRSPTSRWRRSRTARRDRPSPW